MSYQTKNPNKRKQKTQKTQENNSSPSVDKKVTDFEKPLANKVSIKKKTLSEKQISIMNNVLSGCAKMIFLVGEAGTSKTYTAVLCALELLNSKRVNEIIYVRSAVESSSSKIGFLPGEIEEKMQPYVEPLNEKLKEFLTKTDYSKLKGENRFSGLHVGYVRGLNWSKRVVLIDEAQNLTFDELKTLTTRPTDDSIIFIMGDPNQSDIGRKSGLPSFCNIHNCEESKENNVYVYEFDSEEIVRGKLVKYMLSKMDEVQENYKERQKDKKK